MQHKTSFEQSPPQHDSSRGRAIARVAGWAGAFVALVLVGSGGGGILATPMGSWAGALPLPGSASASAAADAAPAAPTGPAADAGAERSDGGSVDDGSPPRAPPSDAGAGIAADGRVILNVATEAELQRLPGVGPTKARAILALRERQGRFRRVEDLLKVRGIGRRTLARLRPLVALDSP